MIELAEITKFHGAGKQASKVLDALSLTVTPGTSVAILGKPKSGKSTLMRILSGRERPDSGTVTSHMSISWCGTLPAPMGSDIFLRDYVRFIAGLYQADADHVIANVNVLTELQQYMPLPCTALNKEQRLKFAFALRMAFDFDCYVMDEGAMVGDAAFKLRCEAVLQRFRKRKTLVLATRHAGIALKFCEKTYILDGGRLTAFETTQDAVQRYKAG